MSNSKITLYHSDGNVSKIVRGMEVSESRLNQVIRDLNMLHASTLGNEDKYTNSDGKTLYVNRIDA